MVRNIEVTLSFLHNLLLLHRELVSLSQRSRHTFGCLYHRLLPYHGSQVAVAFGGTKAAKMRALNPSATHERMKSPDRTAKWLQDLVVQDLEEAVSELGDDGLEQNAKGSPVTPRTLLWSVQKCVEVSPTDTSFSGDTTFDASLHPRDHPVSPTPGARPFDDASDITSLDGDREDLGSKYNSHSHTPADENVPDFSPPPSPTLDDPRSDGTEHVPGNLSTSLPSPSPYDPNIPRLVCIISCLQCTIAGLFCSRTLPSCSRCKRNGTGDTCLARRRVFPEEMLHTSSTEHDVPSLLKVRGDDDDGWARKLQLAKDLMEKWRKEQEEKNWVLPDAHRSGRAGYSRFGYSVQLPRLGGGKGRVVYADLCVDIEF